MSKDTKQHTAQTTGHAWDGDLQEFNNPLPRWWLWSFYATVVFAVVYWVFYPAWPIGKTYTKGVMNTISYTNSKGEEVTSHWNTRALYEQEMAQSRQLQEKLRGEIDKASYEDIIKDSNKSRIAKSMAKVVYADNCQACHQAGGAGILGKFPNLADDDWLWGGSFVDIEKTIRGGRNGSMPGFAARLNKDQISDLADYVLSLSRHEVDAVKAKRGQDLFMGDAGCVACHGKDAKGIASTGSANLTDSIWTVALVPEADTVEKKHEAIANIISKGISRQMPAWQDRLSASDIKILTLYVHELGGGK